MYKATSPQLFAPKVLKDVSCLTEVKNTDFDKGTVALVGYTASTYTTKRGGVQEKRLSFNLQWVVALASPSGQF
jgi:hypothetical protein